MQGWRCWPWEWCVWRPGSAQDAQQGTGQPARAVRLSYVDGPVKLAQGNQVLADQAVANTPLLEGMQLTTADNGRAEIQFEDGSVARLAPDSSLTLQVLSGSGTSANAELLLNGGLAYFEFQGGNQAGQMSVQFGDSVVTTSGFTVLRVAMDNPPGKLAVFSGNAHLQSAAMARWPVDLHGGESIALNAPIRASYEVAESIEPDSWDAWNSDRDQALTAEAAASNRRVDRIWARAKTPHGTIWMRTAIGTTCRGKAMCGRPYDAANAGFDPYGNGDWMYTPGLRLPVGLRLSVGLYAVPVRSVELLRRLWLGMGAGNGRLQAVVGHGILRRPQYRPCARRLSPHSEAASTARADQSPEPIPMVAVNRRTAFANRACPRETRIRR